MIVSLTMGIVMAVVIGLASLALCYFLLKKIKAGQKAGVITGLFVGIIVGTVMIMMAGRAVVIRGLDDYGTYFIYGSPDYEFSNGASIALDMGANETYILNDTDMELVLEEYVYTTNYFADYDYTDMLILPMSITKMPGFKVNYYFDERPPDEITVSENSGDVTKYWLRTKESYESEYGPGYYSDEIKSIPVGNGNTANSPSEEED